MYMRLNAFTIIDSREFVDLKSDSYECLKTKQSQTSGIIVKKKVTYAFPFNLIINYKNRSLQYSGIIYKCATNNCSFWRAKERICCSCSHMSGLGNQKIIAAFRRSSIKERKRKIQSGTGTLVGQS